MMENNFKLREFKNSESKNMNALALSHKLSHKIQLDPTMVQEKYFRKACGIARFTWNWALAEWQRQYQTNQKPNGLKLKKELSLTVLFITHNLGLINILCDRVVVLCKGKVQDDTTKDLLFSGKSSSYARSLLAAFNAI